MQVADLTADNAKELGVKADSGVMISGIENGSPAQDAGLRQGMVILKVGKKHVSNVEEFKAALKGESLKDGILLYVHARNGNDFVLLKE